MIRKFTVFICSVFILLTSCKKNNSTSNSALLSSIKQIRGGSMADITESFVYDNNNRIIEAKIPSLELTTTATISYEPGMIFINPIYESAYIQSANKRSTQITYSIDGNGIPLLRTSYDSIEYSDNGAPASVQRDYNYDTTQYFYNSAGLITKKVYSKKDSTYFEPGGSPQIIITITQIESDYTYSGGFLSSVTKNTQISTSTFSIVYNTTIINKQSQLETWIFDDTRHFPNKWDYTNQVVVNELGFLPDIFINGDINKNNSDLPFDYVYSSITKDENGNTIATGNYRKTFDFSYSGNFMSSTDENGQLTWVYEYK